MTGRGDLGLEEYNRWQLGLADRNGTSVLGPPDEAALAAVQAVVAAAQAASAAAAVAAAAFVRLRVDAAHPVFAVLSQQAAASAAAQVAKSALLAAALPTGHFATWVGMHLMVSDLLLQLHQVTWLVVSVLR